jgi:hypothetical protein
MKLYQIVLNKIRSFFLGPEPIVEVQPEKSIYNPLKVLIGRSFTLNDIDHTGLNFVCRELRESTVEMFDRINHFVDYHIYARTISGGSILRKLRVAPDKRSFDKPYRMVLFSLMDELAFDKNFEAVVRDGTGIFKVDDDEKNIHEQFWRINDVKTSYVANVKLLEDLDGNGKVDRNEVKSLGVEFWDYQRKSSFDGVDEIEYLLIEMNKVSGYFQLWRGKEISPYKVLTF